MAQRIEFKSMQHALRFVLGRRGEGLDKLMRVYQRDELVLASYDEGRTQVLDIRRLNLDDLTALVSG